MAGIDKIYGTREQYIELKQWLKQNRPSALKDLYDEEQENRERMAISNFSENTDMWLLKHCPLIWVTDYIKWQYGI